LHHGDDAVAREGSTRSCLRALPVSAVLCCVLATTGCRPQAEPGPSGISRYPFTDISDTFGAATVEHHLTRDFCDHVERSAPPGVCLLDHDGDGDLDVFTTDLEGSPNHLYENDGDKLVDVSAEVGLDEVFDSIGCLAFDIDGDGDDDLLVTNNGPDQLYENVGGTFENVTERVGLVSPDFSTSATAGDIDGDGDLDLFIGRFIDETSCDNGCFSSPHPCEPTADSLYDNRDGVFVDVTAERGDFADSQTLAVAFYDFDRDGDLDLYTGSDSSFFFPDHLYLNDGTGHFVDDTRMGLGHNEASTMGLGLGDVDNNGVTDVAITDFMGFASPLYLCGWDDGAPHPTCSETVIEWDSFRTVRWYVGLHDFDGDGNLDAFQTTGHVSFEDPRSLNYLAWGDGSGAFHTYVPADDADPLAQIATSRGAVSGDLDNDGDLDLVVANAAGRPQILRNDVFSGRYLQVELDRRSAGARVQVVTDARHQYRDVIVGGGFLGTSDPRLQFGVGDAQVATVHVTWLDGTSVTLDDVATNRSVVVERP
jgi:hypothetical protein